MIQFSTKSYLSIFLILAVREHISLLSPFKAVWCRSWRAQVKPALAPSTQQELLLKKFNFTLVRKYYESKIQVSLASTVSAHGCYFIHAEISKYFTLSINVLVKYLVVILFL
ncbi:hypothetical protein ILYODFUR_031283 [Ilyodon furcidens]|uniref:Secreted protein n=1 Tax=Ilyodon furcidens TaxID=33524 RepID=A0ABV0VK86_9TELE